MQALTNLGLFTSAACMLSYAYAQLRPIQEARTFHQWVRNQADGRGLSRRGLAHRGCTNRSASPSSHASAASHPCDAANSRDDRQAEAETMNRKRFQPLAW